MNQKVQFIPQKSRIIATFGCLGKTTFSKKYPHLSHDLETSYFKYIYDEPEKIDVEKVKGDKNRSLNSNFPKNYLRDLGKIFNKKAIIFTALSPEILKLLSEMGINFDIIYPYKTMKNEIVNRAKNRGNTDGFIKNRLINNLSNNDELDKLKKLNPRKIIIAKNTDTIETILSKDDEIKNIHLSNSGFDYKNVHYNVIFKGLIGKEVPVEDWCQVYVVGRIKNQVPAVKYNKKGVVNFNLPGGGGSEKGETFEQTLRREVMEELNMNVIDFEPIGHQINIGSDGKTYHQLRVFANLEKNGEFVSDIGGNVVGYELFNINDLNKKINWGEVGDWFVLTLRDKYERR